MTNARSQLTHKLTSRWTRLLVAAMFSSLLSACAAPGVEHYQQEQPRLDVRAYLNGPLQAYGMFQDRSGAIVKRFRVDMVGQWQGNQGTLDERFSYSDGSSERRIWRLQLDAQGRITGQADDVVGTAKGRIAGNTMQWAYTLKLPVDGQVWEVDMDDWLVLIDEKIMLNRATMSKWGIRLGEVTLTFVKP